VTYDDFSPFYEIGGKNIQGGFVGKVLFSIFLGVLVLGMHFLVIGRTVFVNYGWVLSIIIVAASLSLFYATHTFRMLLPKLGVRLSKEQTDKFMSSIHIYLSDKGFILYGIFFGVMNSLMGLSFGLPEVYDSIQGTSVILFGYFVAGFVCGLALSGIIGVTKCIKEISNDNDSFFDYTSQDKCGGTRFIGWSLLVFSIVTLIVGGLITIYISFTVWDHKDFIVVKMLYSGWILLPYIASIFVLVVPAISINKSLTKYKMEKDKKFTESIKSIFDELERKDISAERKSELYADYEFQTNMRKELYEMRTWPFSVGTNSTYLVSVGSSIFTTYSSVTNWFSGNVPTS
jgi:ABC-type multidrug transport system fused ATPase/permease subunit